MNRRAAYVGLAALALLIAGCTPNRKASNNDGTEATSATASITECKLIGANTVHVAGQVRGVGRYQYLKLSFKVEDKAKPGAARGDGILNAEAVEGGYAGNTDVQVGEAPIQPVCVITDVTGPGGQPL